MHGRTDRGQVHVLSCNFAAKKDLVVKIHEQRRSLVLFSEAAQQREPGAAFPLSWSLCSALASLISWNTSCQDCQLWSCCLIMFYVFRWKCFLWRGGRKKRKINGLNQKTSNYYKDFQYFLEVESEKSTLRKKSFIHFQSGSHQKQKDKTRNT